jgi:hypothetical protein
MRENATLCLGRVSEDARATYPTIEPHLDQAVTGILASTRAFFPEIKLSDVTAAPEHEDA